MKSLFCSGNLSFSTHALATGVRCSRRTKVPRSVLWRNNLHRDNTTLESNSERSGCCGSGRDIPWCSSRHCALHQLSCFKLLRCGTADPQVSYAIMQWRPKWPISKNGESASEQIARRQSDGDQSDQLIVVSMRRKQQCGSDRTWRELTSNVCRNALP